MTSKLMEDMMDEFLNKEEKGYYIEVAKRMLKDNMSIDSVCKYTNLSFEEVTEIINELNVEENK